VVPVEDAEAEDPGIPPMEVKPQTGVHMRDGEFGDISNLLQRVFDSSVPGFNASDFVSEQFWVESTDGTKVPYFVNRAKRFAGPDAGPRPALLYGYGGFNISLNPSFSSLRLQYLQNFGGVHVIANIRGGGEFGNEWHKGGALKHKQ